MKNKMKVLIGDFAIAKYGGIVEHVSAKAKALRALGHEVDLFQFTAASTTQRSYDKKVAELKSGAFQDKLKVNSQQGGYEYDEATGYWKNNYYGFFLPPGNRIGVFEPDALDQWRRMTADVDLIIWNFAPTKSSEWERKDGIKFDFWWRFFDLPSRVAQMFVVHDAYFDIRASNISALRDKIWFLECAHVAAYGCCANIGIPRTLLLNPRYIEDGARMPVRAMNARKYDFFAAHIFKSMKHVDDLIRSVPHLNSGAKGFSVRIAGSGIEQAYMVAKEKCKEPYKVSAKRDPDIAEKFYGQRIWDVAERFGMEYLGQISGDLVRENLLNAKFAVDPSWAEHYANYCRTHINGFIIEAMLCGCYPVLRDYRGLIKGGAEVYDPLFENINAVIIPWDATPLQFANALRDASRMSPAKYLRDTRENFALVKELFNSKNNMEEVLRLVSGGRKRIKKELECGKDSDTVRRVTDDMMENFFGIELPIEWETD